MLRIAGWVSILALATACSGGGDSSTLSTGDGATPPTTGGTTNSAPIVTTTDVRVHAGDTISTTLTAMDADGDTLTFDMISGPDWMTLSTDGNLTGTPGDDDIGTFELVIEVDDGTDTTRANIDVTLFMDPVEQAFETGDVTYITNDSDTDAPAVLLDEIERIRAFNRSAITEIFQLNADGTVQENSLTNVNWTPPLGNSRWYTPVFGDNMPLLTSNGSTVYSYRDKKFHFAVIGDYDDTRYLVVGSNPIGGTFDGDDDFDQVLKNTVEWLIPGDPTNINVVIAQKLDDSETSGVRNWLRSAFPDAVSINEPKACDGAGFPACIDDDPDLIIMFQGTSSTQESEAIAAQVKAAMEAGIPLIHPQQKVQDSSLGSEIVKMLGVRRAGSTNFFSTHLKDASPHDYVYGWEPDVVANAEVLVNGIEAETLDYDLSVCSGPMSCEENEAFNTEIAPGLNRIRNLLDEIDTLLLDPFQAQNQNRFHAALLLAGDHYRNLTTFPMPKSTTSSTEIIRALFGEYSAVLHRRVNPAMPDLGSFSRTTFEDGLLQDAEVTLTAAPPFKTSGFYALPGETVTVSKIGDSDVGASIRVNSLSDESGRPFRTADITEYERPSIISSNTLKVPSDGSLEFTSPLGGPIHVYFTEDSGEEIQLSFKNVAEHPVWRSPEDNEKFLIDLAADEFDWAEFVRPNFELHATIEYMQATLDNAKYSGPADLADAIDTYLRGWPVWLDGQKGNDVPENPDLLAFKEERQLRFHLTENTVTHRNSDRAGCEENCLGNPYDSFGPFDPLAYSDQYVAAEKLANTLLRFGVSSGVSIIDLYAYHTYFREYEETGIQNDACGSLPFEDLYGTVQAGHANGDPVTFIENSDLAQVEQQNGLYIQLMAALQSQGALDDGWQLLPRHNMIMHEDEQIVYRNYVWPWNSQTAFCFNGISQLAARNLPRNDWLLVTLSCAAQRDLSDYLEMWGYEFRENIKTHVGNRGFETLQPAFYAIPPTGHCTSLDYDELPVDGVSTWPQ